MFTYSVPKVCMVVTTSEMSMALPERCRKLLYAHSMLWTSKASQWLCMRYGYASPQPVTLRVHAGHDARANHASGIQAPLTRVVATPCYRAPEVSSSRLYSLQQQYMHCCIVQATWLSILHGLMCCVVSAVLHTLSCIQGKLSQCYLLRKLLNNLATVMQSLLWPGVSGRLIKRWIHKCH